MWISKTAKLCEGIIYPASKVFSYAGAIVILGLMLFIFTSTILRYAFNSPIAGDYEVTEFAQGVIVSMALAYTMAHGRHVVVRLLSLPERVRVVGEAVVYFIALVIFALISWQSAVYGAQVWRTGTHSGVLQIPAAPFLYVLALGSALLSLALLVKVLYSLGAAFKR